MHRSSWYGSLGCSARTVLWNEAGRLQCSCFGAPVCRPALFLCRYIVVLCREEVSIIYRVVCVERRFHAAFCSGGAVKPSVKSTISSVNGPVRLQGD